jgi:hypothetical protein
LRIELEPPWFSSGEGELLAVLLDPTVDRASLEGPPRSWWAADPVWASRSLAPLSADHFINALAPARSLSRDPGGTARVLALSFEVTAADGTGYCHVDLQDDGYFPFVSLTLARYQPGAIAGVELSTPVQAGPIPLPPRRRLTAEPTGEGGLILTLAGPTHGASIAEIPAIAPGAGVRATLQRRLPGSRDELGWRPAEDAGEVRAMDPGSDALWKGLLVPSGAAGELRVLIEEFEVYRASGDDGLFPPGHRLTYAEALAL